MFKNLCKKIYKIKLKALSLIEVSIALIISGLIIMGAMQGWKWVESARISNTSQQILQIQMALNTYKGVFFKIPRADIFWSKLSEYGGPKPDSEGKVMSSIGGIYSYKEDSKTLVLEPVTPSQAIHIKQSLDQNKKLNEGWLKISNYNQGRCLEDNNEEVNDTKDKVCSLNIIL